VSVAAGERSHEGEVPADEPVTSREIASLTVGPEQSQRVTLPRNRHASMLLRREGRDNYRGHIV
jgi:hypothetical protein